MADPTSMKHSVSSLKLGYMYMLEAHELSVENDFSVHVITGMKD